MALNERVRIARRFLRSVRIDADLGAADALEGFICPQSSADVLITMARHVSETGQGAFSWTGPYGSGKSSLVGSASLEKNGVRLTSFTTGSEKLLKYVEYKKVHLLFHRPPLKTCIQQKISRD